MANLMPYSATTREITVSVEPTYLDVQSSPSESRYVWAYRIVIENEGHETVQLRNRHWRIMNSLGSVNEVKGPGVVGEQPVLKPGETYEYTSSAPLNTPSGLMTGTYQMQTDGGEVFNVEIPTFSLDSPHHTAFVH